MKEGTQIQKQPFKTRRPNLRDDLQDFRMKYAYIIFFIIAAIIAAALFSRYGLPG